MKRYIAKLLCWYVRRQWLQEIWGDDGAVVYLTRDEYQDALEGIYRKRDDSWSRYART